MPATTLFRYTCACGAADVLLLDNGAARCASCGAAYPITDSGAIVFTRESNEQNEYFDTLYKSGKFHKIDDAQRQTYDNSTERARHYLAVCGVDLEAGLTDVNVLDV